MAATIQLALNEPGPIMPFRSAAGLLAQFLNGAEKEQDTVALQGLALPGQDVWPEDAVGKKGMLCCPGPKKYLTD